ncbi:MAG TPA: hypothetical protein VM733_20510 [Thermoanaerobaculia bacterium]|nr:hypothetical protein [Thermoanaerobaculia bacterium]
MSIDQVITSLRDDVGVDLSLIFNDENLSAHEKIRRARTELFHALCARGGFDERELDIAGVEVEPNLFPDWNEANRASRLTGPAVLQYVSTLTSRMEQMAKASGPDSLARMIAEAGLCSVGVSMMGETLAFLRGGQALQAALRLGIGRIGMATAIGAVVMVLAVLIYWFNEVNPKKLLGVIINATGSPLVVKNWRAGVDGGRGSSLFMAHGAMKSFMQDYQSGDLSKVIQINPRFDFGPRERICSAGLFFAEKNFGVYGAEGIMVLSATDDAFHLAHMFAVPYHKDNGTNVAFTGRDHPDLEWFFRELYNQRGTRREIFGNTYHASSTINDARGGTVGCIAYIGANN